MESDPPADDPGPGKTGWQLTLADMESMARERAEQGWETLTVAAGDTAPEPPAAGERDRFGFVYVVGDDDGAAFAAWDDDGAFTEYDVYRASAGGDVFLVTELRDPAAERSVFIAGQYTAADARDLLAAARERDAVYTHVQTLDGTVLASFEHDEYPRFFPGG
ncbi:hypothetical protein BRC83_02425 [Halobacteriales archaeon QS_1_68_17]|nr:MAG: hypothetical protein BRC83_02425 [Halobacteriales archaeon QS_1_68_17]